MATDANLALQASVTKTATFNGTGLNIPTGTPRRGMKARFLYSAATNASGSNSVTFGIDVSADNSTWYSDFIAADQVVNLSTTAQSGEVYLSFETGQPYVRASAVFAGAGSTPTITYQADIELGRNH
jgi:hypothetical protein